MAMRLSLACRALAAPAAGRAARVGAAAWAPGARPLASQHRGGRAATVSRGFSTAPQKEEAPVRYGPLDVDLQPRDQLRPLLPTWNPPPTRPPRPEELEVSTRLRFKLDDRWWAAAVREVADDKVKVGYDGWPSRHDEWVPRTSDRMYLHESSHEDYVAPPTPQRYQRAVPADAEGNPLPVQPRPPRPRVYDPEKERLKRALRPPLPYNPEKERLKRLLRGQYAPPVEEQAAEQQHEPRAEEPVRQHAQSSQSAPEPLAAAQQPQSQPPAAASQQPQRQPPAAAPAAPTPPPAPPAPPSPPTPAVEWTEVPGGVDGARAFRHAVSGEVIRGKPPGGWVELLAEGGKTYFWHVQRNVTQWERPQ